MVDSKAKGRVAEMKARDALKSYTDLDWERTPLSGALDPKHMMKGDIYVPGEVNNYCVEVKHYKDSHFNHLLLSGKNPMLIQWWDQTLRESKEVNKWPFLMFKHNRSKWYCASWDITGNPPEPYVEIHYPDRDAFTVCMFDAYMEKYAQVIEWIKV